MAEAHGVGGSNPSLPIKRKEEILVGLILLIFLISGCVAGGERVKEQVFKHSLLEECKKACQDALSRGENIENGPCLLDPMSTSEEWVCDIAHKPRKPEDNLRENQCNAWHNGTAKHFIELTPECELIKIV